MSRRTGASRGARASARAVTRDLLAVPNPAPDAGADAARRAIASIDAERERIEMDLHDGLQQRLTALRIRLATVAERFEKLGDQAAGEALHAFGDEVELAIGELRDVARGVYPSLLTSGGLAPALAAVARRSAQEVTLFTGDLCRYPPDVETAVYFSCLAAIDNSAKHAGGASVNVRLWEGEGALRFSVRDRGRGFDPYKMRPGVGTTNMRERIAAVGGKLSIHSEPGRGTRVDAVVPLEDVASVEQKRARRRARKPDGDHPRGGGHVHPVA